jgi:hypothetical protein
MNAPGIHNPRAAVIAAALAALAVPAVLPAADAHARAPKQRLVEDAVAETLDVVEVRGTFDQAVGRLRSASEGAVSSQALMLRPVRRAGEVLEAVPGVAISQHSGEGKANQYYLRGFNLDHGTDLALFVAGLPVNMPTHGHGQGYADLSFVIPELVSGVQFRKGVYFADEGDFSAAGAAHITYRNALERPIAELTTDRYGYRRGLLAGSRRAAGGELLGALEAFHNDGPWVNPNDFVKWNGILRWSRAEEHGGLSVSAMGYDGRWNSTDQIPGRAVSDRTLDRFGAIDPSDGGESHRYSLSSEWLHSEGTTTTRLGAYAMDYRLRLWSNFTYFLDDSVNGDQFEQADDRMVLGARASHAWRQRIGGREVEWTAGLQTRHDRIDGVGLHRTLRRARLSTTREDDVLQTSLSPFAQAAMQWTRWARTVAGLRGDVYWFDVESSIAGNSGAETASLASPKASLILGPWRRTAVFLNAGIGFHSNDARGSTIAVDPKTLEAASRVDPLVRAKGFEAGVRTAAIAGVQAGVSVWTLGIDSELLFVGDAGTTEASRPSRRTGIEWSATVEPLEGLAFDADVALSRARFRDDDPAGDRIPGAVERVIAGGVSFERAWPLFGSLRVRHFGPRPLVEDNAVRSGGSTLLSAVIGWKWRDRLAIALEAFNLTDAEASDIDYFYASRLPGEAPEGVDDVHTHPIEPRTFRLRLTGSVW